MAHDTSSFRKVAVLTGLTMLVGGAEISSADTIFQTQNVGLFPQPPLHGPDSTNSLSYNLFNPSLGFLTNVTVGLTSQIFETNEVAFTGNLDINSLFLLTIIGTGNGSGQSFNASFNNGSSGILAAFSGLGAFPADFHYTSACEPPVTACGEGWSGSLEVTYTYTPVAVPLAPPPFWLNLLAGLAFIGLFRRLKRKVTAQV